MRLSDQRRLTTPYSDRADSDPSDLARALDVECLSLTQLRNDILGDVVTGPPYGVGWWAPHPGTSRRILISDQLVACAMSTSENLVEAALHYLEYLDYVERESDWFVDAVSVEGSRLVVRSPRSRHAMDDIVLEMVTLHLVGIVRAVAGALDCLSGVVIGVAALPTSVLRADFGRTRRVLRELTDSVDVGRTQQLDFGAVLERAIAGAGPDGWLDWALAFRNMLVHRGRRLAMAQFMAREPVLYGPTGRPIPRTRVVRQLPADPGRSDVEVLLERERRPVLTEDADVTLESLVRSTVQLVEVTARALTSLWAWRRANPQALAQPREQWPDGVAPAQDAFRGYAEGTVAFSPTSWMSHPTVLRRLRAAALDDAARPAWNTFD